MASAGTRAVVVTARGDRPGIDFVSRVFGPNAGVPEDPVTGSAHCMLAEYWGERLARTELVGEQASSRGGIVRMRRDGHRVVLGGQAVTTDGSTSPIEAGRWGTNAQIRGVPWFSARIGPSRKKP